MFCKLGKLKQIIYVSISIEKHMELFFQRLAVVIYE